MNVIFHKDVTPIELGSGVTRRILAYDAHIMPVEVSMVKGALGASHSHPHAQVSYILCGAFEFTVEGEAVVIRAGDTITFPSNAVHSSRCLEDGVILDVFAPMREDFVK